MEKKKVLFLIHTLGIGGAEKVLVNLANHMDKNKFDVTVMTIINTGDFINHLDKSVHYKSMFKLPFIKNKNKKSSGSLLNKTSKIKTLMANLYKFLWKHANCEKIYKHFIKEKYDIEVSFLEGITAKVIAASNNPNSTKFAWIHVDLINETKSEKVFKNIIDEKNTYEQYDKIVCVSKKVQEQFIKKFDYDAQKVIVKYNANDDKDIIKKSNEKIPLEKDRNTIYMCTVGRLSKQKGYDRLLKVIKKLKEENYRLKLLIIGVGPEEDLLKKYTSQNNLDDIVEFLGFQSNPYPYIKNSDLFVCSSRAEGFSTVVSEAIILHKPVITTLCSGMEEMFEDSKYGLITDNNEEALYKGIKRILDDKKLYNYYKKQVATRSKMFDINNVVKEVERLLGDSNEN